LVNNTPSSFKNYFHFIYFFYFMEKINDMKILKC
jgi:hypothetical protein